MRKTRALLVLVIMGLTVAAILCVPSAKALRGIHGIEVGMNWANVMEALRTAVCEDDMIDIPGGFCVALHDSDLFRHAHCRFDAAGKLVELGLTMREVRGIESTLQEIDSTYNLELSTQRTVVHNGTTLSIRGNTLFIRDAASLPKQAQSKRGPTRIPVSY